MLASYFRPLFHLYLLDNETAHYPFEWGFMLSYFLLTLYNSVAKQDFLLVHIPISVSEACAAMRKQQLLYLKKALLIEVVKASVASGI